MIGSKNAWARQWRQSVVSSGWFVDIVFVADRSPEPHCWCQGWCTRQFHQSHWCFPRFSNGVIQGKALRSLLFFISYPKVTVPRRVNPDQGDPSDSGLKQGCIEY
jgi:hypothetical protein